MYCSKCGTLNDDNAFRCIKCANIVQQLPPRIPASQDNSMGVVFAVIGGIVGLFVLIAIVGILAAIAIPQFSAYRTRSYNAAAQADLRSAITAQEAYYVDNGSYTASIQRLSGTEYALTLSQGVTIEILSAGKDDYHMTAFHCNGDNKYQINGPNGTVEEYLE